MDKEPFLIFFLSLVFGIFFQDELLLAKEIMFLLFVTSLLLMPLVFFRIFLIQKLKVVFIILSFFSLGILLHYYNSLKPDLPELNSSEILIFRIEKKLNSTQQNKKYIIESSKDNKNFRAVLSVSNTIPEFDFNHYYRAKLNIKKPSHPEMGFQFDYAKYLERQKVFFVGYLPGSYEVAENNELSFFQKIKQHRFQLLSRIDQSSLKKEVKNFLKGIILADRTEMGEVLLKDFNRSGLTHFIAISGTHIVIIYWVLMLCITPFFNGKNRIFGIILSLLFIWGFAFYIGFGNSVVRSCIMITVYYVLVLLQRKTDLLHSLSLAGLIILFIDTQQLFDLGFQLSFIAVFGIFWLNQPLLKYFPKPKNIFQKILINTFTISLSAQLATIPLVLFYFHQFSWVSIPANLIIVPISEIIIVSSLVMTLFFSLNFMFHSLEWSYDVLIGLLLKMIHWFGSRDFLFSKMIPMSLPELIYTIILLYFLRNLILNFTLKTFARYTLIFLGFILLRTGLTEFYLNKDERVTIKNYKTTTEIKKQGKVAEFYITNPSNKEKMIQYLVEPYLTSRRIKEYKIIYKENNDNFSEQK